MNKKYGQRTIKVEMEVYRRAMFECGHIQFNKQNWCAPDLQGHFKGKKYVLVSENKCGRLDVFDRTGKFLAEAWKRA